ncbi:MAG: thiamine phosphate synthase [Spirochaetia bacterium]|nr:thiamine phosphate synthase [Spirochaetia bacterium]
MKTGIYPILDRDLCFRHSVEYVDILKLWQDFQIPYYQLRAKGLSENDYVDLAENLKERFPSFKILANDFLVSSLDRNDIFSGVHLGQEDLLLLSSGQIKMLADRCRDGTFIAGISTHNEIQVKKALSHLQDPAGDSEDKERICWSYIALGPVFKTSSKPGGKDPVISQKDRENIFHKIKSFSVLENKNDLPEIVLIGGLTAGSFQKLVYGNFKKDYGFFPVPSVIASAMDRESLVSWKSVLESYIA